jgi:hypothetical protein
LSVEQPIMIRLSLGGATATQTIDVAMAPRSSHPFQQRTQKPVSHETCLMTWIPLSRTYQRTLITIPKCGREEDGIRTFTRLLASSLIPKSRYLCGNWYSKQSRGALRAGLSMELRRLLTMSTLDASESVLQESSPLNPPSANDRTTIRQVRIRKHFLEDTSPTP